MNPETSPFDLTSLAVAVGRIEEKLTAMSKGEDKTSDRLERLESGQATLQSAVDALKAQQRPRTPWWVVISGLAGTVTAILGFWTLFNLATDIAQLTP